MASLIEAIEIKRKMFFELDNAPYHCLDVEVSKPTARGGQTLVRIKMRNLLTRAVFDRTFKAADIVVFATPIWWGGRASLMQRVIERLDALDEEYIASGRSALYNKVASVVITGSEDGALSTLGTIMMVLTFMGFTLPPECCAYWVGEVGQPPAEDREKRLANEGTKHMAKNLARNAIYYAQLLKERPLVPRGS